MYKTSIAQLLQPLINLWRGWWRKQTPNRQDRFAFMAPLAAVVLFMAAITTAFWYLRYEEIVREQEVVRRDVEYAQQRLRLRLLDKQEQIMRIARDIANRETDSRAFATDAQNLLNQSPELASLTWLDARQRVHGPLQLPTTGTGSATSGTCTSGVRRQTFQLRAGTQVGGNRYP